LPIIAASQSKNVCPKTHIPSRQAWHQTRLLILLSSGVTYLMKTAVLSLNLAFQGAILPTTIRKDNRCIQRLPSRTLNAPSSSTSLPRRAGRTTKATTKPAPNGIASSPGGISRSSPRRFEKGQLVTLEGILRYREVEDEVKGTTFKHRIAEIHAISMKRLSKVETADDPSDGADDE
jgi:hypothetical protein